MKYDGTYRVEVSHDAFVTIYELPAVISFALTDHGSYKCVALFCPNDPVYWYLRDNDLVSARFTHDGVLISEGVFRATDLGFMFNPNDLDGDEIEWEFEPIEKVT